MDDSMDDSFEPDESMNERLQEYLRQFGLGDKNGAFDFNVMLSQLQQVISAMGSTAMGGDNSVIDWTQTRALARRLVAAAGPDPVPSHSDTIKLADAARLAELWLDDATLFPQTAAPAVAWSRAQWVEALFDAIPGIAEPIGNNLTAAMVRLITDQTDPSVLADSGPFGQLGSMLTPLMRGSAGMLYAQQLANTGSELATSVLTGTELGIQLFSNPRIVWLPTNFASFVEGQEELQDDLLIYLCLREAARQRLYQSASWLAPQLNALLQHYAREISIDSSALNEVLADLDMDDLNPERLREASEQLQGRLFSPSRSQVQLEIIERLETLLALVDGWVDHVTTQASKRWMTSAPQLSEVIRRRRAVGNPPDKLFETLVGLQTQPRKIRDAQNLWAALEDSRGIEGRDHVWSHPDLVPQASDLNDPLGYVAGERQTETDDLDDALRKLLDEGI